MLLEVSNPGYRGNTLGLPAANSSHRNSGTRTEMRAFSEGCYRLSQRSERHMEQRHLGSQGLVDRKSTRLNSSHGYISYAVFCLKKKKKTDRQIDWEGTHTGLRAS